MSELNIKLPDGVEQYANDIRRFVDAMIYKLDRNKHKGRWEQLGVRDAMTRLKQEVKELEDSIEGGNTIEIILEAADIANFGVIVASIIMDRGNGSINGTGRPVEHRATVGDRSHNPTPDRGPTQLSGGPYSPPHHS